MIMIVMLGMKAMTVPVVIGALGIVKKCTESHVDIWIVKITELQKIAILRSSRIFWSRALMTVRKFIEGDVCSNFRNHFEIYQHM